MEKHRYWEECTRMIQKRYDNMERLFFLALLLTAVQQLAFADTTRETRASRTGVTEKLQEMCYLSYTKLYDRLQDNPGLFHSWVEEIAPLSKREKRELYFHDRPVDTPPNSICQPMNTTCCQRRTEKHIIQVAKKEYGELFLNVTYEHIGGCLTVGRHFYHAMHSNFDEIRRQMEIPINNLLGGKLPSDLFDYFFRYLSSFSVSSDLCDLPLQLQTVMFDLFTFIYEGQSGENLNHLYVECFENVSTHVMASHYNKLFVSLERQLYNLDLIFRAMHMSETIIQRLMKHRISSVCTKPLTQLQNCGHCTGYVRFKPCLFYCLNVFKGCLADVADVHREFALLTKALSDIPDDILVTFQPENFIGDSLRYFVQLTNDLTTRDIKREVADTCNIEESNRQKRSVSQHQRLSSNLAAVTPTATQEDDRLLTAFSLELQCMEDIVSLLKSIPEQMCYQSKQHKTIADTGNDRCWTGSRMGSYYHSEISSKKEEQVDNPEFRGGPLPYLNQYTDLCMDISTITAEVNETLDLVLCLDDEDCSTTPFYICEDELELLASGSGLNTNGSGSGSGQSMDDGLRDMEDGDSPLTDDNDDSDDVIQATTTTVLTATPLPTNIKDITSGNDYTVVDIEKIGSGENATVTTTNKTGTPDITEEVPGGKETETDTPDITVEVPGVKEDETDTPDIIVEVPGGETDGAGFTGRVEDVVASCMRLKGSLFLLLTAAITVQIGTILGL